MPPANNYWLLKTEPSTYSIDDLMQRPARTDCWDGVRNYQARNFLRDDFKKGDYCFLYHSSCPTPAIVGIVEVVREAYPDLTALDPNNHHYDPMSTRENPRWYMVDVKLKQKFARAITLEILKQYTELKDMRILQRGNRLSVTPVTRQEWELIVGLATK
jgi:predicted RNA-binding protein with PUA-like domain